MSSHFSELIFSQPWWKKGNFGAKQKHSTRPAADSEGLEQHRDISVYKTKNITESLFFYLPSVPYFQNESHLDFLPVIKYLTLVTLRAQTALPSVPQSCSPSAVLSH